MTDSSNSAIRLEELLVEQTDRDLTFNEASEVQKLLRQTPDWEQDDIELAAAATLVAITAEKKEQLSEMPRSLREKISQQAQAHFLLEGDEPRRAPARGDTIKKEIPEDQPAKIVSITGRTKIMIAVLATAASIAIAFTAYQLLRARTPDAAAMRGALLAEAEDAVTIPWSAAGDPLGAGATGDVVWSNAAQAGYMRFVGLPKNDATKLQYQLWIFDAERDDRYPVDGGVFDVDVETGEVIVAIDPKIRVTKATMFAVTVERPGGVVVSTRERLALLAKTAS